jgi:hypothetical protein
VLAPATALELLPTSARARHIPTLVHPHLAGLEAELNKRAGAELLPELVEELAAQRPIDLVSDLPD